MIKIKKGLNIPIHGLPVGEIVDSKKSRSVAILGSDYVGMKPTMFVNEGEQVKLGQPLFEDKKNPGVIFTSPAGGKIEAINRGDRRVLQSIVIEVEQNEEVIEFKSFSENDLSNSSSEDIRSQLISSGMWTSFRTRPYSKIPTIDSTPANIFISALDTQPLSLNPENVINLYKEDFIFGLSVLKKLVDCPIHLSLGEDSDLDISECDQLRLHIFSGPHPAGLVGTHIHFLSPVSAEKTVWHLGYQDVIAIGHLFASGKIYAERVVALAGPGVESPRLIRTVRGGSLDELGAGEYKTGNQRVLSGSVFDGRTAQGALAYLGRFHNQVSVLAEGTERELFGFVAPGTKKFSVTGLFMSSLFGLKNHDFTTSTGGSNRAMVPIGTYEKMMPLDILPTQLLRALLVNDVEVAMQLGCLELDEEDLALCTFACPGKYEYGPYLRQMLTLIEAEG